MKHNYFYFFYGMLFLYTVQNLTAMEFAGGKISEADAKGLRPWDKKNVTRGTIVAYRAENSYVYAILHKQEAKNPDLYSIIVERCEQRNKVLTTRGLVVGSEALRLLPSNS